MHAIKRRLTRTDVGVARASVLEDAQRARDGLAARGALARRHRPSENRGRARRRRRPAAPAAPAHPPSTRSTPSAAGQAAAQRRRAAVPLPALLLVRCAGSLLPAAQLRAAAALARQAPAQRRQVQAQAVAAAALLPQPRAAHSLRCNCCATFACGKRKLLLFCARGWRVVRRASSSAGSASSASGECSGTLLADALAARDRGLRRAQRQQRCLWRCSRAPPHRQALPPPAPLLRRLQQQPCSLAL